MLEPMQPYVFTGIKYGSGADSRSKRTSAGLRAVVFGPAQVTVGALLRQSDEMRRQSDANFGCVPARAPPTFAAMAGLWRWPCSPLTMMRGVSVLMVWL